MCIRDRLGTLSTPPDSDRATEVRISVGEVEQLRFAPIPGSNGFEIDLPPSDPNAERGPELDVEFVRLGDSNGAASFRLEQLDLFPRTPGAQGLRFGNASTRKGPRLMDDSVYAETTAVTLDEEGQGTLVAPLIVSDQPSALRLVLGLAHGTPADTRISARIRAGGQVATVFESVNLSYDGSTRTPPRSILAALGTGVTAESGVLELEVTGAPGTQVHVIEAAIED